MGRVPHGPCLRDGCPWTGDRHPSPGASLERPTSSGWQQWGAQQRNGPRRPRPASQTLLCSPASLALWTEPAQRSPRLGLMNYGRRRGGLSAPCQGGIGGPGAGRQLSGWRRQLPRPRGRCWEPSAVSWPPPGRSAPRPVSVCQICQAQI